MEQRSSAQNLPKDEQVQALVSEVSKNCVSFYISCITGKLCFCYFSQKFLEDFCISFIASSEKLYNTS